MRRRRFVASAGAFGLAGCAPTTFKPLEFPPDVPLQDPLPEHAIVYLLRAPHDGATVAVYLDHALAARLPPSTYTAVSLAPGRYTIASTAGDGDAPVEAAVLTVAAGERRFLYTSVPSESHPYLAMTLGPAGVVPLLEATTTHGQRTWHECRELDAQGLMSIGRVVAPERGFL